MRFLTDEQIATGMLLDATHFAGVKAYRKRDSVHGDGNEFGEWFDDTTLEPLTDDQMQERWEEWARDPNTLGDTSVF